MNRATSQAFALACWMIAAGGVVQSIDDYYWPRPEPKPFSCGDGFYLLPKSWVTIDIHGPIRLMNTVNSPACISWHDAPGAIIDLSGSNAPTTNLLGHATGWTTQGTTYLAPSQHVLNASGNDISGNTITLPSAGVVIQLPTGAATSATQSAGTADTAIMGVTGTMGIIPGPNFYSPSQGRPFFGSSSGKVK